jgi:hypothetical protein
MTVYLDNCAFNRPFDDQSQLRIRLESEAKLEIQAQIRDGALKLVWSYILDYENEANPFPERRWRIGEWREFATRTIVESENLLAVGKGLVPKGLKKIDSLHLACALEGKSELFFTTDDGILKKRNLIEGIKILNPVEFITQQGNPE